MAKEIAINELSIPQLNQLSQQLEQELEVMQSSLGALKGAQNKFSECRECLSKMKTENLNKDILVPLTSSMYVSGQLSDIETVLVDIGTGYYIEKNIDGAKDYYQRKVEFLATQMEKIQPLAQEKFHAKEAVMEYMQMKIQAQLASQQQAAATKS